MVLRMDAYLQTALTELRYQPSTKRVRVQLGGAVVADTTRAVLVWEPRRVVPSYAIPVEDFAIAPAQAELESAPARPVTMAAGGPPVLDPSTGFGHHTCSGVPGTVTIGPLWGATFRPDELDDLVVLDFDDFEWFEEEEPIFGHPRDPFSHIDLRNSTREVRIEHEGQVIAESRRPLMLFETQLPVRYYLPRDDVRIALLRSATATTCAYKGHATHWSNPAMGPDLGWSYESPPPEMHQITGLICFYQEKLDFTVDGEKLSRPATPWSD
ncbi:DUF427 domain-containing protein [Aldersonia kunmingensis]|uniref:DUF427 domain-containing protein n=1 Tax=Aldersonia kunmingensis TaxID=408066 RepID=UPI00082CC184|nr:DUF427 domain-containing protein [Aldersonia kunmingensis]